MYTCWQLEALVISACICPTDPVSIFSLHNSFRIECLINNNIDIRFSPILWLKDVLQRNMYQLILEMHYLPKGNKLYI